MPRRVKVQGDLFHGRVPAGAVYVGRPAPGLPGSRYANPFRVKQRNGVWIVIDDNGVDYPGGDTKAATTARSVELFRRDIEWETAAFTIAEVRAELAGWNLACWCRLPAPGQPDQCHGAPLLAIANPEETHV